MHKTDTGSEKKNLFSQFLYHPNLKMNSFSCIAKEGKCCFPIQNKQGNISSKSYKITLYSTSSPSACTGRFTFTVGLFVGFFFNECEIK